MALRARFRNVNYQYTSNMRRGYRCQVKNLLKVLPVMLPVLLLVVSSSDRQQFSRNFCHYLSDYLCNSAKALNNLVYCTCPNSDMKYIEKHMHINLTWLSQGLKVCGYPTRSYQQFARILAPDAHTTHSDSFLYSLLLQDVSSLIIWLGWLGFFLLYKDWSMTSQSTTAKVKCPLSNTDVVSATFDHSGGVLINKDGIKITIPEGAIKDGDLVTLYTAVVDLCALFVLPSQSLADLVSPFYWIGVTRSYQFQKPVQVAFKHFAVGTDPSRYKLLCCNDDDRSYTMRPVDYKLKFEEQGDISWCMFKTRHFCSYCLEYESEGGKLDTNMNKIIQFVLISKDYQTLSDFKVEIVFTLAYHRCIKRIKDLCGKRGMEIDEVNSNYFEASFDKSSTSYFEMEQCDEPNNGWNIRPHEYKRIKTNELNFHNGFTCEVLQELEECSLFPPRFKLYVKNIGHRHTNLDTNIFISLYDNDKQRTKLKTTKVRLFIHGLLPVPMKDFASIEKTSYSLPEHCRNCSKPIFKELCKYIYKIAYHDWQVIAAELDIPRERINTIDIDHSKVTEKCCKMFNVWLDRTPYPCWCHFIQALYAVELKGIAEDAKQHLRLCKGARTSSGRTVRKEEPQLKCAYVCNSVNMTSSDIRIDISKTTDVTLNVEELRNLKDVPKLCSLRLITCLLPNYRTIKLIKYLLLFSFLILILVILYIILTTCTI